MQSYRFNKWSKNWGAVLDCTQFKNMCNKDINYFHSANNFLKFEFLNCF